MDAAPETAARLVSHVVRQDRGRILSALIRSLGDFQLAEDSLQDALESALTHWGRSGVPDNPPAWLMRVGRRKAIDRLRRAARFRDHAAEIARLSAEDVGEDHDIADERLRLIFTCCHPALDPKSRVALTLRTLGGLSTAEIARAFLDNDPAMGQRLSRAKAKIATAGIPFAIPDTDMWPERLQSVLTVVYLIFNEGYAATDGPAQVRVDLCDEAIWLGRMLLSLCPDEPEVMGLVSLMLTTHARRAARVAPDGALVPLDAQDRGLWDRPQIDEGLGLLDRAIMLGHPGPFQIKAAIGALHVQAERHAGTDWRQMILLYDSLLAHEPSSVVRLNRAVAICEAGAPQIALDEVRALAADLSEYQPFQAALAELLMRTGDTKASLAAYDRAIALSGTDAERKFLAARRARIKKKAETSSAEVQQGGRRL